MTLPARALVSLAASTWMAAAALAAEPSPPPPAHYFNDYVDRFGVQWMVNYTNPKQR